MAYTKADLEGRKRPAPKTMEVKSIFGFTSDFCLSDKGYTHLFEIIPLFVLYRKGRKFLVQYRGKEWKKQRDDDYVRLRGMSFEEAQKVKHVPRNMNRM